MDTISIMKILLEQQVIVYSWGITKIKYTNCTLQFNVSGYKYIGKVALAINQNTISITLYKPKRVIQGVQPEKLVNTLDLLIERTEDYKQSVLNTIAGIE